MGNRDIVSNLPRSETEICMANSGDHGQYLCKEIVDVIYERKLSHHWVIDSVELSYSYSLKIYGLLCMFILKL